MAVAGAMTTLPLNLSTSLAAVQDAAAQERAADKQARLAEKALERHRNEEAVGRAEQTVLLAPQDAGYRALLGRAYLAAGRFVSAAQVLEEALVLSPGDGRVALNLSLARIALGDPVSARRLLDDHAAAIQPADRGLAIALAGDPGAGIEVLGAAARAPSADAKVRQNLALALALAGRWQEAHVIAAIDLSPADAMNRIVEWARFVRPVHAWDQVASLLGVTPVEDGGMPVQLALRRPQQPAAVAAPAVVPTPASEPPAVSEADVAGQSQDKRVIFAAPQEVVQAMPLRLAVPPRAVEVKVAARQPADGRYYVQLGAFESAAIAQDAWRRLNDSVPALARQTPYGATANVGGAHFYRLSVGGYTRADANALCRDVRARGASCFVRKSVGEVAAHWAGEVQLAAR
ncbi:SPOR domain-containing protein [Sphingomonas sp. IW22]|uniref:SPOR domain-containing protein n=1 Tax=Sphingomonas sp. IW22 TaxID=3242489 RepID=UPI00351F8BA9